MTHYNLQALLKIRERNKETAERQLQSAISNLQTEQAKLKQIEMRLQDNIVARRARRNNFFHKAQIYSSTKTEVACHIASNQKTMADEIDLRKSLAEQQEMVKSTSRNVEIAKSVAIDAHRNLKVIEKHFSSWQRRIHRAEELKEEYENDDQNGVRYLLKKA